MQSINVCFASDIRYVQHLAVAITSLLSNTKSPYRFTIHLLYDFKEGGHIIYLNKIVSGFGATLVPHEITTDFSKHKLGYHFTPAIYHRINLPQILPAVDKCLYLDCDLIICDDVCELYNVNIDNYLLAGIEEPGGRSNNVRLGIPQNSLYFNSGVLLLNMLLWREGKVSQSVNKFIEHKKQLLVMPDQDALNAILYDKWLPVHPRWNVQTAMFTEASNSYSDINALTEAINNPAIIHYSTSSKPWQYMNNHPMKAEYYKYLKMTKWANYVFPDKTLKNIVRKIYYTLICKKYI